MTLNEQLSLAKGVCRSLGCLSSDKKNEALAKMAERLVSCTDSILEANKKDVAAASGKISDVMIDRLSLTKERIKAMADGMLAVAKLPDPVGVVLEKTVRSNGLIIEKTAVPVGVVAIIYESRPNVTSDAAALCFKSGNACILRSGKEAWNSSNAVTEALRLGLEDAGLDKNFISLVQDTSRQSAIGLMTAVGYVDLLIPRGGAGLIKTCVETASVPCIETGTGICHVYVDKAADLAMALEIINNAKTSRPSVCNAAEVLLVHEKAAKDFLPMVQKKLVDERIAVGLVPVQLRLDEEALKIINGLPACVNDYDTEFLDYILAVKVVSGVEEAVEHISAHSTGHSEAIISQDDEAVKYFVRNIDSAALYVNASTRFTDGGEFGLGCEMGISTQKLHARGPMGLKEMMTYKYIIIGNGQIR